MLDTGTCVLKAGGASVCSSTGKKALEMIAMFYFTYK